SLLCRSVSVWGILQPFLRLEATLITAERACSGRMDVMARIVGDSGRPTLRREVEAPQRQPTGLGVMLIASAAMFFAVAGSAFIVRARMAGHCCDRAHPPARVQ